MGGNALDIRLLGSPVITVGDSQIAVDTRKAIGLLAYLTVEGSAERDTLAALFWAESPPDRARATLRRTLSALRNGVGGETIIADRNRVGLADGFTSDIAEFQRASEEIGSHGHDPSDVCARCIPSLSRAADLYRGDFLGAFSVRDAPDFEDWARTVAESFRLEAGEVFERLAMALATTGDYSSAIATARRWLGLDELHEPAHRLLMLLHAWAGDRAGSMQTYRECVAILDRELGVAPLEETTELFDAILDEDLPPAPGVRRAVRTHPAPVPARQPIELIDRRDAIGVLEQAIRDSRSASRLCILSGDSWMGKTRLLELGAELADAAGHRVVTGVSYRAETQLPYAVAIQLIEALTIEHEGGQPDLPGWVLEELTRLVPRLSPGATAPDAGLLGQLRLRDAFLALAETVASDRPLAMFVDDAQWIDPASAGLLAHIRRRTADLPLLLVISSRAPEMLHPALRELVADAEHVIDLAALRVEDLADEYPGADLPAVISATSGIPLLTKEALDTGTVSPESSSVARYIESRRQRMSDLASQVLAAAAVLNGMCEATLLRDTSGRTEDEIVEAVEELVSSGLLYEQEDGRLGFSLDVLERITYESTSLVRRRLLHRRAAEALESRARTRLDARLATATAGHLRHAGHDDAADWYRLAGDLARGVYANQEAVTAYETAIALGHPEVGSLHLALGELAMAAGEYDTATRELQGAAAQSEGPVLAVVEHRIGDLNRVLGRFDLAEESFDRADAQHPRRSNLYADWALLRHRVGDELGALELARRSQETAQSDEETARALNILGLVTREDDTAMSHIDQALSVTHPLDPARMAALNNKAHLIAETGDHETAIGLVGEAIELASRAGYRHQQAALLNHLADLYHRAGRRDEAESALTEAVRIFADIDAGDWQPEVWLLRQW